ncbi:unnamed protein product [Closterium sp. Yama58-4]|nr:unnamed protein product [Closterium sp. Yama58-4]
MHFVPASCISFLPHAFRSCLMHFVPASCISFLPHAFRSCLMHFVPASCISFLPHAFRSCLMHFVPASCIPFLPHAFRSCLMHSVPASCIPFLPHAFRSCLMHSVPASCIPFLPHAFRSCLMHSVPASCIPFLPHAFRSCLMHSVPASCIPFLPHAFRSCLMHSVPASCIPFLPHAFRSCLMHFVPASCISFPHSLTSLTLLAPPCLSLPLPALSCHPSPFSNGTTKDYNILYTIDVTLTNPGEPTRVIIMKGADVALTVATSTATWTNRTLTPSAQDPDPTIEMCKTIPPEACLRLRAQYQALKAQNPPPPPPTFLGYTYETAGTWLSASTLKADNGQTYKQLVDSMLAAPDAYSALVFAFVEAGAASGAFANSTLTAGNGTAAGTQASKLSIKTWRPVGGG